MVRVQALIIIRRLKVNELTRNVFSISKKSQTNYVCFISGTDEPKTQEYREMGKGTDQIWKIQQRGKLHIHSGIQQSSVLMDV